MYKFIPIVTSVKGEILTAIYMYMPFCNPKAAWALREG